jgi:hypothetical protein
MKAPLHILQLKVQMICWEKKAFTDSLTTWKLHDRRLLLRELPTWISSDNRQPMDTDATGSEEVKASGAGAKASKKSNLSANRSELKHLIPTLAPRLNSHSFVQRQENLRPNTVATLQALQALKEAATDAVLDTATLVIHTKLTTLTSWTIA